MFLYNLLFGLVVCNWHKIFFWRKLIYKTIIKSGLAEIPSWKLISFSLKRRVVLIYKYQTTQRSCKHDTKRNGVKFYLPMWQNQTKHRKVINSEAYIRIPTPKLKKIFWVNKTLSSPHFCYFPSNFICLLRIQEASPQKPIQLSKDEFDSDASCSPENLIDFRRFHRRLTQFTCGKH